MMKRHIYHYITLLLLLCVSVSSCREMEMEYPGDSMFIELQVSCVNLNETRATMAGVDNLNENKIDSLHYFLYPAERTDGNAVLAGKIGVDKLNGTNISIPLNEGILNDELIPYPNTTCEVFLIANLPSDVNIDITTRQNTSLPELEAKVVTANFLLTSADGKPAPQPSFVMTGKGTADLISRKEQNAVSGTIELRRLAAKYTVRISVDETFIDPETNTVWHADINNMQVHIAKAVRQTKLSGDSIKAYFDYHDRTKKGSVIEDGKVKYFFDPFYSYPSQWNVRDDDAFALFIKLPWREEETGASTPYYYKVFPNTTQLNRNTWYNVDLHIGVLGSINPTEAEVELKANYSVMDWNNGNIDWSTGVDESTSIQGARYLIVDKNLYVVNNLDEFEIPFISSDTCKIDGWTVKNTIYSSTAKTLVDNPITSSESRNWLTLEGNTIKLNHTLNNNFLSETDKSYDCTPYVFTINLRHAEEGFENKFCDTITIIQKPAICITADKNSYADTGNHGYQFVNGVMASNRNGSGADYGGASGIYQTNTTDPYMYVIEVSVLPDGSDYILGDPRSTTTPATDSNSQGLDFENFEDEAPGVEGTPERKLTNYYYTQMDDSVENMIAPKFRMASSHSTVASSITYVNAYNRAATYQEDGYLAGRWRVPTWAELRFVAKLCSDSKIGQLFSNQAHYWCGNGLVTATVANNGTTTIDIDRDKDAQGTRSIRSVRPVYDDWYWEHSSVYRLPEGSRGTFTWGDEL